MTVQNNKLKKDIGYFSFIPGIVMKLLLLFGPCKRSHET